MSGALAALFIVGLIAWGIIKAGSGLEQKSEGGCGGCLIFIGLFIAVALILTIFRSASP